MIATARSMGNEHQGDDGRRFDRGSWVVLGYALWIILYNLAMTVVLLSIPGDGWIYEGNLEGDLSRPAPRIVFTRHLIGTSSPIQPGDELVAIEGRSVAELADQAHAFYRQQWPTWPDGTVLRYTVQRDGQTIALDVPIARAGPADHYRGYIRLLGPAAVLQLIASPFFFSLGAIVFALRPGNGAARALLILGTGFLFEGVPVPERVTAAFYPIPPPSVRFDRWMAAILPSIIYLMLTFPAPRWPVRRFPRLTPVLLYLWAPLAIDAAYLLNLDDRAAYFASSIVVYLTGTLGALVTAVVGLIYAALTLHGAVERAQLKWMAVGILSFMLPGVGAWVLGWFGIAGQAGSALNIVGFFLLPICLALAITRHRLCAIDVVIRRTLVYTLLSAALALIYFGSVVLLQALLRPFADENNSLVTVVSTLLIAALFQPLRRRIQAVIDRRFYRRKYDAARTLQAFNARVRDQVELSTLTDDVLDIVQDTLQPAHVSLWLRPTGRK